MMDPSKEEVSFQYIPSDHKVIDRWMEMPFDKFVNVKFMSLSQVTSICSWMTSMNICNYSVKNLRQCCDAKALKEYRFAFANPEGT
jgi:hypothetical protein